MICREEAEKRVIAQLDAERWPDQMEDFFVIQSSDLSADGGFWIIRANSDAYVNHGDFGRMYIGASCYLVDVETGDITGVGSLGNSDDVIQDILDERKACGAVYMLGSACVTADSQTLQTFRKTFICGILFARELIAGSRRDWFSGKKRILLQLQRELESLGLPSEVRLALPSKNLVEVHERDSPDQIFRMFQEKINDGQ